LERLILPAELRGVEQPLWLGVVRATEQQGVAVEWEERMDEKAAVRLEQLRRELGVA
jgi:hypothetical protein